MQLSRGPRGKGAGEGEGRRKAHKRPAGGAACLLLLLLHRLPGQGSASQAASPPGSAWGYQLGSDAEAETKRPPSQPVPGLLAALPAGQAGCLGVRREQSRGNLAGWAGAKLGIQPGAALAVGGTARAHPASRHLAAGALAGPPTQDAPSVGGDERGGPLGLQLASEVTSGARRAGLGRHGARGHE